VCMCICACGKVSSIMFSVSFKVTGLGTLHPTATHTHTQTHTHRHTRDGNSGADRHVRPAELEASAAVESPEKAVWTLLNVTKLKAAKRKTSVNKSREQRRDYWKCRGLSVSVHDK